MQTIQFSMPFDLVKSGREGEMRIGGYASTAHKDRQGESVMQKSLDISEFVSTGFFNLDHDNSKILGYPDADLCRIDSGGFYAEGTLLNGVPEAESIYRTAMALKKSNAPRRLGFSVEGEVLERDGMGLITKAKVYNVAITSQPVNPNCTWDALCKSFAAAAPAAGCGADADITATGQVGSLEPELHGLTTKTGAALIPESLETSFRNLAQIVGEDEEAAMYLDILRQRLRASGKLSKSELALYFTLTRGLPLEKSKSIVEAILV